jgi:hypothetical protein
MRARLSERSGDLSEYGRERTRGRRKWWVKEMEIDGQRGEWIEMVRGKEEE